MSVIQPERLQLAQTPTPLVRLPRLESHLGAGPIWMKRDDLSGLELSGNKIRKLEYVAAETINAGCDTIVTEGTAQSNHCRATAAVCARLGLGCSLLLRPIPPKSLQGNQLLDQLFGAQMHAYSREEFSARRGEIVESVLAALREQGRKPRFTPMGASEPLGCWGYIRAAAELATQLHAAGVERCDVVTAISSGATYAGLLLGKLLHRLDHWRLWAVPVSDDVDHHRREVLALCNAAIERFALPISVQVEDMQFIYGYVGAGYAIPYEKANEALRMLGRTEAIVLDPVYTAKAFCALIDGVRERRFGGDRPVVFIHTGGVFSNFAWPELAAG